MNLIPKNQINLYGLEKEFDQFVNLFNKNKLPNKIMLSGQKGNGKSTLSYHLINYFLSLDEDNSYDIKNYTINKDNKSFRLIQNNANPNFFLLDIKADKKLIEINQIRTLIDNLNKSSFNQKPRFVLIDNIEFLNLNSTNALLKSLEEPPENTFFFLIHNEKKILDTLRSRCLNFRIFLSHKKAIDISNRLLNKNIFDLINKDLLNYYISPGKIFNLIMFSETNKIDLKNLSLKEFLLLIIENSYYKKENSINYFIFDFIEFFLKNKATSKDFGLFNYFLDKINNINRFNLDEESLFIEFKSKLLNG